MTGVIDFAVWAPDEATFWASWVTAGIVTAPHTYTSEYPGVEVTSQSAHGWIPPDANGDPITGWHANVRVTGPLVAEMTYGIDQHDEGALKNVFDRTWATLIFQLEWREADATTGFPAGYRNATGVWYCDPRDFKSPTNTWL